MIISIDLSDQDINQCSDDDPFFPNTHKCDRETTEVSEFIKKQLEQFIVYFNFYKCFN